MDCSYLFECTKIKKLKKWKKKKEKTTIWLFLHNTSQSLSKVPGYKEYSYYVSSSAKIAKIL